MTSHNFIRGMSLFQRIHGGLDAQEIVDKLTDICPDLARYSIEWVFGDLYANDILKMRDREISNISAIIAIGAYPQLKNHLQAALKLGLTKEEIQQIILNTIIIVGFPAVVNSMLIFAEVLHEIN